MKSTFPPLRPRAAVWWARDGGFHPPYGEAEAKQIKVFCFFFSKKKSFS
jgi:hypothetical protein